MSLPHVTCPPASRVEELVVSQIPLVLSSAMKTRGRRVNSRAADVEAVLLLREPRGRACCCDGSSQGRQTASLRPVFKDSSVPRHQTVICSEFLNFYFWLSFLWQCFTPSHLDKIQELFQYQDMLVYLSLECPVILHFFLALEIKSLLTHTHTHTM